jgi:hypothetical protein
LGSTLYTLLTGRNAFTGESLLVVMNRVLSEPPPPIDPSLAPASLRALIEQMMAKDPDRRPASARIVGRQLREVQRELGFAVTPLPIPDEPAARPPAAPPPPPTVVLPPVDVDAADDATVARALAQPRERAATTLPEPADQRPREPRRPVGRIVTAAAVLAAFAAIAGYLVLTASGDDDTTGGSTTTARSATATTVASLELLVAPTDVAVAIGEDGATVTWRHPQPAEGVTFEVHSTVAHNGNVVAERTVSAPDSTSSSRTTVVLHPVAQPGDTLCVDVTTVVGGLLSPRSAPVCEVVPDGLQTSTPG